MKRLFSIALALLFASTALADDHEGAEEGAKLKELIARVVDAYGGESLTGITGYRIAEKFLTLTVGQSHSPTLQEIAESSQVLNMDMANKRSAYDTWFYGRDGGFQGNTISDGETGTAVNHRTKKIGEAGNADPYVFAGGTMRTSDAVLVYELSKTADKATLGEDAMYQNRKHHVVTMPFPSSPDLNLYIDAETFLVSKMLRNNPQLGALDYVFSDYRKDKGITYAGSTQFSIAGAPNLISKQRKIEFNPQFAEATFAVPEGFEAESERTDTSEMAATKISDRVYHVGQGNAYTLFIDTPTGLVATGGYAGLANRLEYFREQSDNFKPLSYQVVTHHHSDHIGGLAEALSAGAKLITVENNVAALTAGVDPAPSTADFLLANNRMTLGDGRNRVEIYEVSTSHSSGYLVVYVPASKTIFIADHLGSPFVSGTPVATQGTVTMLAALDELGIDIDRISTAHSARIFSMKEMRDSVREYSANECLNDRPVCALAAN